MAKKKKKPAGEAPKDAKSAGAANKSSTPSAPQTAADIALAKGNYSAVRALAKSGDAEAEKLFPLIRIDMGQVAAGIVAFLVVTTIALITVHGG